MLSTPLPKRAGQVSPALRLSARVTLTDRASRLQTPARGGRRHRPGRCDRRSINARPAARSGLRRGPAPHAQVSGRPAPPGATRSASCSYARGLSGRVMALGGAPGL